MQRFLQHPHKLRRYSFSAPILQKADDQVLKTSIRKQHGFFFEGHLGDNLIYHKDAQLRFGPRLCHANSELLRSMAHGQIEKLSDTLSVLNMNPGDGMRNGRFRSLKSKNQIFIRSFYPQLLDHAISHRKVALTGNKGVGKSEFLLYYLACLVNKQLHKDLPHGYNGLIKTVFHHKRMRNEMEHLIKFSIDDGLACTYRRPSERLVQCFDQERTIYLFEAAEFGRAQPYFHGINNRTLAVMPSEIKSHGFASGSHNAVTLVMPVWTLDDLLTAAEYVREKVLLLPEQRVFYRVEEVQSRYEEFGGNFKAVLPIHNHVEVEFTRLRRQRCIIQNPQKLSALLQDLPSARVMSETATLTDYNVIVPPPQAQKITGQYRKNREITDTKFALHTEEDLSAFTLDPARPYKPLDTRIKDDIREKVKDFALQRARSLLMQMDHEKSYSRKGLNGAEPQQSIRKKPTESPPTRTI